MNIKYTKQACVIIIYTYVSRDIVGYNYIILKYVKEDHLSG